MFEFTSLLGAQSTSHATQSLLQLKDGVKILIDVGWDESFDETLLSALEKQVPSLSFILLTHATISHLGAYAHCCKHVPLFGSIPVFATTPVINLGRTLTQDLYKTAPQASSVISQELLTEITYSFPSLLGQRNSRILRQPPTVSEIATYFARINQLKYSQPHQPTGSPFSSPLDGLTVTAYNAGHSLGGTIWHIQHGQESLVYATDWNQAREHVFAGAAWLGAAGSEVIEPLRRPTALICSSRSSQRNPLEGGRAKRDNLLIEHITTTISQGGTVLIPTDSAARVLELSYMLENAWLNDAGSADDPGSLKKAGLFLASASAGSTFRNVRSLLEWMEEGIIREFESAGQRGQANGAKQGSGLPFDFRYMRLLERQSSLQKVLNQEGPKVIIASDTSMDWGFSKQALESVAANERNLVILTDRPDEPSRPLAPLGAAVWKTWLDASGADSFDSLGEADVAITTAGGGKQVDYQDISTQAIEGDELTIYQRFIARQRQLNNELNAAKGTTLEIAADAADEQSSEDSESSDESDTEHQGRALNTSAAMTQSRNKLGLTDAELGIDILIRRKGHHDYDVQGKKGRERSYPVLAAKRNPRTDDFGEAIRPEDYLRAEERVEADDEAQQELAKKESGVGEKRRWGDVAAKPAIDGSAPNGTGAGKKKSNQRSNGLARPDGMGGATTDDNADVLQDDNDSSDSDPEEEEEQGPRKLILTDRKLTLNLRIAYIDFCGLHDKRSLQMLIPLIRPRKLILIGGNAMETAALAEDCERLLNKAGGSGTDSKASDTEVLTPAVGVTIDASVDTSAWMIRASKPFAKHIHWQTVRGLSVVALTGSMAAFTIDNDTDADESSKKKLKAADGQGADVVPSAQSYNKSSDDAQDMPVIDSLPAHLAASNVRLVAQQSFHVGDLRLAELRKLMQQAGFAAEFRGEGTLLVNGVVAVRKGGTGRLEVEGILDLPTLGGPDPTFYDVRRKVYEGLAVVAGS